MKIKSPSKINDGTKLVYKKAINGLIPKEIIDRKKTWGFSQPSALWFRNDLKDFVYDIMLSQSSFSQQYIDSKYMNKLFSDHVRGITNNDYLLNSLLIFELWLQDFIRN